MIIVFKDRMLDNFLKTINYYIAGIRNKVIKLYENNKLISLY